MNELLKAYNVLGLEPGASLEAITRRHKRLVMVWHPDRFPVGDAKKDAEEELKKINVARDKLKHHFEKGGHQTTGPCACRAAGAQSSEGKYKTTTGASDYGADQQNAAHQKPQAEDDRTEKDERRREEREAGRRATKEANSTTADGHQQAVKDAFSHASDRGLESLSWWFAVVCAAVFVILLLLPMTADSFEKPVLSVQDFLLGPKADANKRKLLSDRWQQYTNYRQQAAQFPGWTISSSASTGWRVRKEREQKEHEQQIHLAKLDVDRYEMTIEHQRKTIAELEAKTLDQALTSMARIRLIDFQKYQRARLCDSKTNLEIARQKLAELTRR